MRHFLATLIDRRAVAAVEFAIIAPVMLAVFGGLGDFGLLMYDKAALANGVTQAAQFALIIGPSVTQSGISGLLKSTAKDAGLTQTVTVASSAAPACYCVTGTTLPAASSQTLASPYTCTGSCSGTWGIYSNISATFTYVPLTPLYSQLTKTGQTVTEAVIVKLN